MTQPEVGEKGKGKRSVNKLSLCRREGVRKKDAKGSVDSRSRGPDCIRRRCCECVIARRHERLVHSSLEVLFLGGRQIGLERSNEKKEERTKGKGGELDELLPSSLTRTESTQDSLSVAESTRTCYRDPID